MSNSIMIEASRQTPIVSHADVLVCGGGPAGIAAAITAARHGADTLLLECHPFPGGVWTAGALTIIIDAEQKTGLCRQIRQRLELQGAVTYCTYWPNWPVYGIEAMKMLLDDMLLEAGVRTQCCTQVVGVEREGGRIKGVYTESKSGREYVEAKIVIDTTGDGDVAWQAGCDFEYGRPEDGKAQPATLYGRIGGYKGQPQHIQPMLDIARSHGFSPSYERVTLFPQPSQPGVMMLMATHLYVNCLDVRALSDAQRQARQEIKQLVAILKAHGGPDWEEVYLIDTGPFAGVREGRRIRGRYYLTFDDLVNATEFDDGICHVDFGVDIHHPDPSQGKGLFHMKHQPYDIPYRCLLAKDAENLMMAGRCISGDFAAHASYRVTGDAVATGEAAGIGAAMAVASSCEPYQVNIARLKEQLATWRDQL